MKNITPYINARISEELAEKIKDDMDRLGLTDRSEYIRMMLAGQLTGLGEIKEQLNRIEKELEELKNKPNT